MIKRFTNKDWLIDWLIDKRGPSLLNEQWTSLLFHLFFFSPSSALLFYSIQCVCSPGSNVLISSSFARQWGHSLYVHSLVRFWQPKDPVERENVFACFLRRFEVQVFLCFLPHPGRESKLFLAWLTNLYFFKILPIQIFENQMLEKIPQKCPLGCPCSR